MAQNRHHRLATLAFALLAVAINPGIAAAQSGGTAQAQGDSTQPQATEKRGRAQFTTGNLFLALLGSRNPGEISVLLHSIRQRWKPGYIAPALEVMSYSRNPAVHAELSGLIRQSAGLSAQDSAGFTTNDWYFWLWNQTIDPFEQYSEFKADLYRLIDPRFEAYFRDRGPSATIRLDEVRWGGVRQDGIPPLHRPKMLAANEAKYLQDDNIVFGIEINGDARAYPKRILAWHEMFTDTIGGVAIAGVYCTLCGAVIPYRTEFNGQQHMLGTSGFLYRSNKLMYDRATQSLWSTSRGEPVVGPLVGKGIALAHESVVTTTWGEWRRRHPATTVLSLNTGFERDYGEGVAYAEYFGTDRLMFNTPFKDERLANKQQVLALRFAGAPDQQLAIDTNFLERNPLYIGKIGLQKFVVLTDSSGANRVYDPGDVKLSEYDRADEVTDAQGGSWKVTEPSLQGPDGRQLKRLPYHRAFWFGWRAAFPQTRLVK